MIARPLSQSRTLLAESPAGVDRRLLYPASGNDVGCSVGLFWNICDSFYLVDPVVSKEALESALDDMRQGKAKYMEGMFIESDPGTPGLFDGVKGVRYQVWRRGEPSVRKRLCFIGCGTNQWLDDTTTRYNVIVNKDYEGISGDKDSEFPYTRIWERLNTGGIFGETLGDARTSTEMDCLAYRCRGFEPLWRVTGEKGEQIGFASGLHLLRKVTAYHPTRYASLEATFAKLGPLAQQPLLSVMNYDEFAKGLEPIVEAHKKTSGATWGSLGKSPAFLGWLSTWIETSEPALWKAITQLNQATGTTLPAEILAEQLKPLKLETWGSL